MPGETTPIHSDEERGRREELARIVRPVVVDDLPLAVSPEPDATLRGVEANVDLFVMVGQVRGSDRRPSLGTRPLLAATCILALLVADGSATGLASTSQAKTHKHPVASPHTSLAPSVATSAFGLDLMRAQGPGNLVLSPDSVEAALAMTGTGAAGTTAVQIARTLHLKGPSAFPAVGDLQRAIVAGEAAAAVGDPEPPILSIANGLFLQQGFPVEQSFLSGLQEHFSTTPQSVDFRGDPTGSVEAVNTWVRNRTEGLIPQLLLEPLPVETRLVLANAVYLKASWLYPFKHRETALAPFYNGRRNTPVEFMHETSYLRYGSGRGYQAVELPYRASTLSLLAVLPGKGKSLGALLHHLGARELARIVHGLSPSEVALSLPRFDLSTQVSLIEALKSLGMTLPFSESADFSRITATEALRIAVVEHAADFKVDEKGTVAAAATAVGAEAVSGPPAPQVTFNANRPFLFFLRDDRTGAVLFAGRLANPASTGT